MPLCPGFGRGFFMTEDGSGKAATVILSVAKDLALRRGQILRYAQDDKRKGLPP